MLSSEQLKLAGLVLLVLLAILVLGYYLLRENMDNVVSIQHKNDYMIPEQMEDIVEKSINENSVVISTNILKPLADDTERSYPNVYKDSKITITPQPDLEKQEFPAIVLPAPKPLQEVLDY